MTCTELLPDALMARQRESRIPVQVIEHPSPNFGARRAGAAIDILLLHYTGMPTAAAARERLCDARAEVSAHYLIGEDGTVYRLVDEQMRAWHAGAGYWAGERDINSRSIGIELANPGHEFGYRPFPEPQMHALIELAHGILARHPIPPHRVLGHSDVAPGRKMDPGELFDWKRLARAGIGVWPDAGPLPALAPDTVKVQHDLRAFGYDVALTGEADEPTRTVIRAFQRHFRPQRCDGACDAETARLAAVLTSLVPATT